MKICTHYTHENPTAKFVIREWPYSLGEPNEPYHYVQTRAGSWRCENTGRGNPLALSLTNRADNLHEQSKILYLLTLTSDMFLIIYFAFSVVSAGCIQMRPVSARCQFRRHSFQTLVTPLRGGKTTILAEWLTICRFDWSKMEVRYK